MKVHIETDRFIIRELEEYDAEGIFELDSDPEVHEFLGKKPIKHPAKYISMRNYKTRKYI